MKDHTELQRRPEVEEVVTVRAGTGWKHTAVRNSKVEESDKSLIRMVHEEQAGPYRITATLTRFGGLYVAAFEPGDVVVWDGDNIIEARQWAAQQAS